MAPNFSIMGSRRVKFLLDLQAECPTRSGVESRPGLRDSFLTPLLELRPQDPLTIKDQGGKDEETQHVASGVDQK